MTLSLVQYQSNECDFDGEPIFNDFWAIYPRRVSKAAALKAWGKLSTEQKELAMGTIRDHVRYWIGKRTETQFIPHASSWLNQARWDDELEFEQEWTPLASSRGFGK